MKVRYQILFAFAIVIFAFSTVCCYFLTTVAKSRLSDMSENISDMNKKFVKSYIADLVNQKRDEMGKIASDEKLITQKI